MSNQYASYIRDVVYLLRERTAQAAEQNQASGSLFDEGREAALREVLSMMQNQADVFGIRRDEVCLDGFEALTGPVAPPKPPPPEKPSSPS